jgi:hypothetical protein
VKVLTVEKEDLDVQLSFGYVLYGKFADFIKIREYIRLNFPNVKSIYHTISGEHLYLMKHGQLTPEQTQLFEDKKEKEKGEKENVKQKRK